MSTKLTEEKAKEILDAYAKWQDAFIENCKKNEWLGRAVSTSPEMMLNPFRFPRFQVWLSVSYPEYMKNAKILYKYLTRCYEFVKK